MSVNLPFPQVLLSEYIYFQEGPGLRNWQYGDSGVPFINIRTITDDGNIDKDKCGFIKKEEFENKYEHFLLQEGDFVVSSSGTLGKLATIKREHLPLMLNTSVIRFRPLDDTKLDRLYLKWFIKSSLFIRQIEKESTGTAIKNYGSSHLNKMYMPLPPLETQKKIAAVLEKGDNLRTQCRHIEQELNSLAKSVFLEMFGDPTMNPRKFPIGTIRDVVSSVNYGTSSKASETDGQYPILRMNNITYNGEWNFTSLKYVNLKHSEIKKYLAKKGDLLFNRTNSKELVGKTGVYREEREMAIAGYLIRVRFKDKANAEYIAEYLNSIHGKLTLQHMCKNIVGMANINAQELQDIKILLPPILLQDKYARFKESLLLSKDINLKQKKELDSLFNVLLQKAFNGDLNLKLLTKSIRT